MHQSGRWLGISNTRVSATSITIYSFKSRQRSGRLNHRSTLHLLLCNVLLGKARAKAREKGGVTRFGPAAEVPEVDIKRPTTLGMVAEVRRTTIRASTAAEEITHVRVVQKHRSHVIIVGQHTYLNSAQRGQAAPCEMLLPLTLSQQLTGRLTGCRGQADQRIRGTLETIWLDTCAQPTCWESGRRQSQLQLTVGQNMRLSTSIIKPTLDLLSATLMQLPPPTL